MLTVCIINYNSTTLKKLDVLSVPYDNNILSSVILYSSRSGRVWWCEGIYLQQFVFESLVTGKSEEFACAASITPVYT